MILLVYTKTSSLNQSPKETTPSSTCHILREVAVMVDGPEADKEEAGVDIMEEVAAEEAMVGEAEVAEEATNANMPVMTEMSRTDTTLPKNMLN
jgi:hypothetical protein